MSGLLGYYESLLTVIDDRIQNPERPKRSERADVAADPSPDETDLAQIIAASVEQVADNATPEELQTLRLDVCTQALAEVSRIVRQPA